MHTFGPHPETIAFNAPQTIQEAEVRRSKLSQEHRNLSARLHKMKQPKAGQTQQEFREERSRLYYYRAVVDAEWKYLGRWIHDQQEQRRTAHRN